jgi:hypothetical protein
MAMMRSWENFDGPLFANTYKYLRVKGIYMSWDNVVWEYWCLPRHNFILWLAMLRRLKTRDTLWFIETKTFCVFCRHHEENHSHLFFACNWTSLLWRKIKTWLKISRCMATLSSATRGLILGKKNLEARMRRVFLSINVYLVWEERNKRIFDNTCNLVELLFHKFQVIFYMILHFHKKNHFIINVM